MNLEDGSNIKNWFATLTFLEQAHMCSRYINYLRGIKDGYLGEAWQSKINRVYEGQYFCQTGHEKELPKTFIIRCIMYTRMLTSAKPGGTLEISLIMRKAPMSWKAILVMPSIKSTKALYTKVIDYEDDLLEAWRRKSAAASAITAENLIPTLRRLGWEQPRSWLTLMPSRMAQENRPQDRHILMTIAEEANENQHMESTSQQENQQVEETHNDMLHEVYQVMQQRQRAPPPGGYMFSQNDHITTKMGKLPPSPCQACGSSNHWDKECPDWEVYRTQTALDHKSSHSTETADKEGNNLYQSAFSILLSQCLAASQIDLDQVKSDFEVAVHCDNDSTSSVGGTTNGHKSRERRQVTVQDVEDEDWLEARTKPKSAKHLLHHVDEDEEEERPSMTKHPTLESEDPRYAQNNSKDKPTFAQETVDDVGKVPVDTKEHVTVLSSEITDKTSCDDSPSVSEEDLQEPQLPPPSREVKPVRMLKKRFYPMALVATTFYD